MIAIQIFSALGIICFVALLINDERDNTEIKQSDKKPALEMKSLTYANPIKCGIIISPQKSNSGKVFFYDLSGNRISKIPRGKRDIALANNCFLGQLKHEQSSRWVPVLRSDVERMMTNESFVRAHSQSIVKGKGNSNSNYVSWMKEEQIGYLGAFGHLKAEIDADLNEVISLGNNNSLTFSRGLSDGSYALLETKMRDDDFKRHLQIELRSLGAEEDEICANGFILGFSSHLQILGQSGGFSNLMQSHAAPLVENGGGKYMLKTLADAPIDDSAKLYDKISQLATEKTVPKGVNLDDYGSVLDIPWYRLISTIAFVNFIFDDIPYPFPEELKKEFPDEQQLISHLAKSLHEQNFNALAPFDLDVELAITLLEKNKPLDADTIVSLMMETINSSTEDLPDGLVAYSDFESCWLAGHLISKAFVQWDETFAHFIRNRCFVPIWNSDYHVVLHSLPCALALDELIDPSSGMIIHRYLNPFTDLKAHSQLIRCLTARMTADITTMRDVGDYYDGSEKAIILRILNDEFCLLAQRCSTVKSGGVLSIPAYQSHINSYDDDLIENDGVYNANEILSGNLISQWLVSNKFIEIVNAITLASYAERVLTEALSIRRGESNQEGIKELTIDEFHGQWLDILEKTNRPLKSRTTNNISKIASKFDLLCPTLLECISTGAKIRLV